MSVSHWWVGFLIDEAEHERVLVRFQEAADKAVANPAADSILEAWKRRPSDFDHGDSYGSIADGERINAFISAFNVPAFRELGLEFFKGELRDHIAEQRFFRFVSVRRCTPVSIVWQVLGPERALLLPGNLGNLLLRAAEVPSAVEKVEQAYS
jgi:hypothetical protein